MSDNITHLSGLGLKNSNTQQPDTNGEMKYVSGTGFRFYQEGTAYTIPTSSGSSTAYDDIGDPDANSTVAFAGFTNTWTSTLDTGSVFTISNTDAALSAQTNVMDLKLTDDGEANGIFLRCLDNSGADVKFTVGADGATTIAGAALGTAALTLTAGDAVVTSGDVTVTAGDIDIAADNKKISFGAAGDTDSYIQFDGAGNMVFFDSTVASEKTLLQLLTIDSSPTITGDLTISDGKVTWTDATDEVAGTWTFAGTTNNDITWSSAVTSGDALSITADALTSGSMVYLESSAAGMSGEYIRCFDGSADDFVVGANGAVTIAGTAAGTDAITLTTGDATITSGDLAISLGVMTVADTADSTNKISRNNATGTAAVLEVEQTHATGGVALTIDQNATGDVNAIEVENAGTGFAVTTTAAAAGGEGYEYIAAASGTGIGVLADGASGSWVGAASTGLIQATSDGTLAQTTASLMRLAFSGTSASGGAGTCLRIEDTSTSGGGTEYAVYIASTNSEGLHVDTGTVQFDEAVTLGVDNTGADFKAFGATTNKFMVWDESADDLILADAVALQLGGDESTSDGFKLEFDGTADLNIDALTANDNVNIGSVADTDLVWHGTSGVAMSAISATDTVTYSATSQIIVTGNGTGTGLAIPNHASTTPSDTVAGSIFFEQDAKKLWVYDANSASWVGVVLA